MSFTVSTQCLTPPLHPLCHITFFFSSQVTSVFLYLCLFQYPFISLAFAPSPSICFISVLSFFSSFYKQSSLSTPIILLTVSISYLSFSTRLLASLLTICLYPYPFSPYFYYLVQSVLFSFSFPFIVS